MEKKLLEYGVAQSNNIVNEAHRANVSVERVARGYTYTTRDDGFPPTPLIFSENPFGEDVAKAKNILEIGCGVGRNLPWIYENTDAVYYGVDPNPVMLENFWNVTDNKMANMAFLLKSFDDVPQDMKFDVVLSTMVMQHLGFRSPPNAMNVVDITRETMKYTREGTIWIVLEHEREEPGWIDRWMDECDIIPNVYIRNYQGMPEMLHRGGDLNLVIWKQD